jgi:SAM-dependent methyltransferase
MHDIANLNGIHGGITIIEERSTGTRSYFEDGVLQAQASAAGESRLAYVHLLAEILRDANQVLLLGCGSGSLATMLHDRGKSVVVVDDNPVSFLVALHYYGMPAGIERHCVDFRNYLKRETRRFDGIGIDIGASRMDFGATFDDPTCRSIRKRLAPMGTIAMNMLARDSLDLTPDRIAEDLALNADGCWLFNEPRMDERNVVICAHGHPQAEPNTFLPARNARIDDVRWAIRRPGAGATDMPRHEAGIGGTVGTALRWLTS